MACHLGRLDLQENWDPRRVVVSRTVRPHPVGLRSPRCSGFSLVITVAMMVLLALLAIGLLSLSTVSLRSSSRSASMSEARANARLALMMAVGQLQKEMGDDRRISRPADQIPVGDDGSGTAAAAGRRHWTGAYDAWDDQQPERPSPRLRAWLVSGLEGRTVSEQDATSAASGRQVEVVGAGTAGGAEEDRVEVPLLRLERDGVVAGRLAWWVGDEGTKAMVATPPTDAAGSREEVASRLQAAPGIGVSVATAGQARPFENLDRGDRRLWALTDWPQTAFLADDPEQVRELFHDLTTRSSGLLVNVREGGFRRDLSMKLAAPGRNRDGSPTLTPLYRVNGEEGINLEELSSFFRLPQELVELSGSYTTGGQIPRGTLGFVLPPSPAACIDDEFFHLKMPVIVSLQVAFSLNARPVGSGRDVLNRVHLVLDPILTLWNPLDVPVVIPESSWMTFNFFQFPYTIDVTAGRRTWECPMVATLSGSTVSTVRDNNFLGLRVGQIEQLILRPGEVVKVSQSGDLKVEGSGSNHSLQAKSGFNYGGGVARPLRDRTGQTVDLAGSEQIFYTMRPNELTSGKTNRSGRTLSGRNHHTRHFGLQYHEFFIGTDRPDQGGFGFGGMSIDFDFGNRRVRPGELRRAGTPGTKPPEDRIYADQRQYADVFPSFGRSRTRPLSVAQLLSGKAPILMYTYSAKTEMTSPTGTRSMLRFNPRAHRIDFYDLSQYERDLMAYDFEVEALNSWINRKLETSPNGNAYFGGSYDAADGSSFVVTHSVPLDPVHSLAVLQHSTANGFLLQKPQQGYTALNAREPMLPQVSHAIGNSFAPSVMSPHETYRVTTGERPVADHSYLANQALWDGWFFSSIASNERTRSSARSLATAFLEGTGELPIRHYRPALGGRTTDEWISELFSGQTPRSNAVERVAAAIRVEGMFNVNSTSVQAWRSLLSSLLGEEVEVIDDSGRRSRVEITDGVPVVGLLGPHERVAEGRGGVASRDPDQWRGRRVLEDEEITQLAEAIVREVRRRGPFLSLADFVNRRVGTEPELARAGAIQNALDSDRVSINEAYRDGDRAVRSEVAGRMPFPEAEEGALAAGIPGVVKQADVLTPLAPVLSARSDSFRVRAYGESVDRTGEVVARAWCEALVERGASFIDPSDEAETPLDDLRAGVNETFGRRFEVISFRWLGPDEV